MKTKPDTTIRVPNTLLPYVNRLKVLERLGQVDRQLKQIATAKDLDQAIAPLADN